MTNTSMITENETKDDFQTLIMNKICFLNERIPFLKLL